MCLWQVISHFQAVVLTFAALITSLQYHCLHQRFHKGAFQLGRCTQVSLWVSISRVDTCQTFSSQQHFFNLHGVNAAVAVPFVISL